MEERQQFNKISIIFAILVQVIGVVFSFVLNSPIPFALSILPSLVMFIRFSDTKLTKYITFVLILISIVNIFFGSSGGEVVEGPQGILPSYNFANILTGLFIITIILYLVLCISFKFSMGRLLALGLLVTTTITVLIMDQAIIGIVKDLLNLAIL